MEAEAEEKWQLTVQTLQFDPGPTQRALGRAPDHPHEREAGQNRQTGLNPVKNEPHLDLDQRRQGPHQRPAAVEGGNQDDENVQAEDQAYAQTPQPGLKNLSRANNPG
jgi:hypothetical protein